MAPRDRFAAPPDSPPGTAWAQVRLPFAPEKPARDETELLHALTQALAVLVKSGAPESALRETFGHAMAGLGAEKGLLIQVRQETPVDVEILCANGLSAEDATSCQSLNSCPGISPTLIRRTIQTGQPTLIEDSNAGSPEATLSLRVRPYSILCAPVSDSLTGSVVAVLYFQNDAKAPFRAEDLEWLTAYANALGHALTLHLSGQQRIQALEAEWKRSHEGGIEIVGESEATCMLGALLNRLLPSTDRPDAPPILVLGESGTGKDLVARYLHHFSPRRSRGPFKAFNCAGVRGDLAEAKLFGHTKGAFTGAIAEVPGMFRAADKGVLFLDEIGEMAPESQALLLRVLETRAVQPLGETKETRVDVQLILATNRSLEEEVAAKRFREDLYHRLNGLRVELTPLRDPTRIADVRPLLAFCLARHERMLKKKTQGLTAAAFRALLQYSWPGNVRELNNVCLSLVTHAAPGACIDVGDIAKLRPEVLKGPKNSNPEASLEDENVTYAEALLAFRRKLLTDRVRRHEGSPVAAMKSLGLTESTFYRYWSDTKRLP